MKLLVKDQHTHERLIKHAVGKRPADWIVRTEARFKCQPRENRYFAETTTSTMVAAATGAKRWRHRSTPTGLDSTEHRARHVHVFRIARHLHRAAATHDRVSLSRQFAEAERDCCSCSGCFCSSCTLHICTLTYCQYICRSFS